MKKKIGLLVGTMFAGGAERVVSRLSSILDDEYEVYVIIFEDTYLKYNIDCNLINLNVKTCGTSLLSKIPIQIKRVMRLRKVKKELELEVVISFLDTPNLINVLSNVKTCKTLVSVRNYNFNNDSKIHCITRLIKRKVYLKADGIITVSDVIKQKLINYYCINKDKVRTIYNPYNLDQIQQMSNEEIESKYKAFFSSSDKIFINIGRQEYQKGIWHLIKAFKLVNNKIPDSKLVLIGEGSQRMKINNLLKDLELENEVLLIDYTENPFKYIKNSNVYVLSSIFEGFPNALVEAMACGCPVITADCKSGPREIICMDQETVDIKNYSLEQYGILVPEMDNEENWIPKDLNDAQINLADAMSYLIENDELKSHYQKQSLLRASTLDYETCKNKYSSFIQSLLMESN